MQQSWELLLIGKRSISIRYCLFSSMQSNYFCKLKILFIATHLAIKWGFFRLATPNSVLGNLCIQKAQWIAPSELSRTKPALSQKEQGSWALCSTPGFCPLPWDSGLGTCFCSRFCLTYGRSPGIHPHCLFRIICRTRYWWMPSEMWHRWVWWLRHPGILGTFSLASQLDTEHTVLMSPPKETFDFAKPQKRAGL